MVNLPGESRDITINGIRVRYVEAGHGPPVLLIHGLGVSAATWRDNMAALAKRHRVYAVDLPGHGDSEIPDISYESASMVDFVRELIAALGHQQIALVGSSLGGGLCLLVAVDHPEIVSKLVLSSSGGVGREVSMILRLASLPWVGELMASGPVDGTQILLRKTFHDKRFASRELLDEFRRTNRLPGARNASLRIIRTHIGLWGVRRKSIVSGRLRRLAVPTLVFWGADDEIIPVKHAYRAARSLPFCDLHVFGNCGHWPHMERADDFNRLTLEFLSR